MKFSEELLWILDKPGTTLENQNEKFQENIEFVHSLGLKCDCVGWCRIDLADSRTPDILNSISEFCKENGWTARGFYTRRYVDVQSDWYELVFAEFKDNTCCDRIETVTEEGSKIYTRVIRAFHELSPAPKKWWDENFVPERFRNFCLRNNLDEFDFCWVRDKGKYEAEQYFHVYGKHLIPHIAVDYGLNQSDAMLIAEAGGWLPRIADVFHKLQRIDLQDCYLADDLPDGGSVYAYIPGTYSRFGRHVILLHKDVVQSLLQQKILPLSAFRPAPVFQSVPGGYSLEKTQVIERPSGLFMRSMLEEYEKLKNTPRPVRMVSEKDALKLLRLEKNERKEDFQKALPKSKREALLNSDYSVLLPYYSVTDGCYLSDEYAFLSAEEAMKENEEFQRHLLSEELWVAKPEGIVFGRCPDGDAVLLCNDGKVVRISHEEPAEVEQWPTLAQFFVDTINE